MGDSQSVHSYRTVENPDCQSMAAIDDGVSLRSLPLTQHHHSAIHSNQGTMGQMGHLNPPRSMSPVSSMSGDELSHGGRRSQRRRPLLDKQVKWELLLLVLELLLSPYLLCMRVGKKVHHLLSFLPHLSCCIPQHIVLKLAIKVSLLITVKKDVKVCLHSG